MSKIIKKKFNGEWFRQIQSFTTKEMAKSYAKGLRKRGIMGGSVKVRITEEKGKYPHKVWVRGK